MYVHMPSATLGNLSAFQGGGEMIICRLQSVINVAKGDDHSFKENCVKYLNIILPHNTFHKCFHKVYNNFSIIYVINPYIFITLFLHSRDCLYLAGSANDQKYLNKPVYILE